MTVARTLFVTALVALGPLAPVSLARTEPAAATLNPSAPQADRTVVLARGLDSGQTLQLATAFAASGHPGVLLLDTPTARDANRRFFDAFRPARVVTVGGGAEDRGQRTEDRGQRTEDSQESCPSVLCPLSSVPPLLFPRADRVVVCPAAPRRRLLLAATLAGAARAPLVVVPESVEDGHDIHRRLEPWHPGEVWLAGEVEEKALGLPDVRVRRLADEEAVLAATIECQSRRGRIDTLVVANPADAGLSDLAPSIAARRQAVLLLTGPSGHDAAEVVRQALERPALRQADYLLLVARPEAIPTERRDNPVPGKDPHIEMEPLTPAEREPFSFATGRLFHADPGVVALMLARPRLLPPDGSPRTALVASNPGGSLPLLETCSRVSARELQTRGYQTTALFNDLVSRGQLRRRLPDCDLFLWEGHHNTLINDWGFATWDEPLRPSLMFLQSCLALTEAKATPLLTRGAVAVVGSSSRIYSATGGAFAVAYLDALLYDRQTLGGSLRQAKNFLLAYSLLKEKRLGEQAKLGGANLRSAWAFTLWGDPALRLPAPPEPEDAAAAVRCRVHGHTITLTVPPPADAPDGAGRYRVPYRPNARLAGLIRPGEDDFRKLVPFAFAEVPLPHAPAGATPRLHSKLPASSWVFCWDARRRVGYLLALPRGDGPQELRFRVEWDQISMKDEGGRMKDE